MSQSSTLFSNLLDFWRGKEACIINATKEKNNSHVNDRTLKKEVSILVTNNISIYENRIIRNGSVNVTDNQSLPITENSIKEIKSCMKNIKNEEKKLEKEMYNKKDFINKLPTNKSKEITSDNCCNKSGNNEYMKSEKKYDNENSATEKENNNIINIIVETKEEENGNNMKASMECSKTVNKNTLHLGIAKNIKVVKNLCWKYTIVDCDYTDNFLLSVFKEKANKILNKIKVYSYINKDNDEIFYVDELDLQNAIFRDDILDSEEEHNSVEKEIEKRWSSFYEKENKRHKRNVRKAVSYEVWGWKQFIIDKCKSWFCCSENDYKIDP